VKRRVKRNEQEREREREKESGLDENVKRRRKGKIESRENDARTRREIKLNSVKDIERERERDSKAIHECTSGPKNFARDCGYCAVTRKWRETEKRTRRRCARSLTTF